MTVLYTKYKAENNAVWTIYVKYDLKIYREVWKFESGKVWNIEIKNVKEPWLFLLLLLFIYCLLLFLFLHLHFGYRFLSHFRCWRKKSQAVAFKVETSVMAQ